MTGVVIPFGRAFKGRRPPLAKPALALPTPFTREWQEQHLPLIGAAMDLLGADDAEFRRRCELMADSEGRSLLEELTAQLDRLGSHVSDVVEALALTAMRIRTTMALQGEQPA